MVTTINMLGSQCMGSILVSAYPSKDTDIIRSELLYTELETSLRVKLDNVESDYPDFDEYLYNLGNLEHNPYELISFCRLNMKILHIDKWTTKSKIFSTGNINFLYVK